MEGYDPSLKALLRRKFACACNTAWQLLPVWKPADKPLDPEAVLDARELEIFRLFGTNRTPREIAFRLFISIQSAELNLTIISRKLRIRRRDLQRAATEYACGELAGG